VAHCREGSGGQEHINEIIGFSRRNNNDALLQP